MSLEMKSILRWQCFVKGCLRPTDHHFISAKKAKQNGSKSIGLSGCLHITANVQPGCICTGTVRRVRPEFNPYTLKSPHPKGRGQDCLIVSCGHTFHSPTT